MQNETLCQDRMRIKWKDEDEEAGRKAGGKAGRQEGKEEACLLYFSFSKWFHGFQHWVPHHLGAVCPSCRSTASEQAPAVCEASLHDWLTVQFGWGNHGVSPAEPCLDKWQMLPAWNGMLLLTVLNFLQNWPVRGSGSSFLAHLSGSDSFCSGIIKRVVSFSFPFQLHVPKPVISREAPAFVWFLGRAVISREVKAGLPQLWGAAAQQGQASDLKDRDLPFWRTEYLPCEWSRLMEPHWLFL